MVDLSIVMWLFTRGYNWVGIWVLCHTRIDMPEYGTLLRHCLRIREYVPDLLGFMSTDYGCTMGIYGIYKQQHDLLGTHIYIYISITNNIFILVNKWVWINNSIFHHRGLKIHEQKGICGHDILYVNVYLDITM